MRFTDFKVLLNPDRSRSLTAGVVLLCVAMGVNGQSGQNPKAGKKQPAPQQAQPAPTDLTWPLPPDPPRIRWMAQYTDLQKIKPQLVKKSSWVDKVTGNKTIDEKLELVKPYGITTDRKGRIYTADTELKTVFVIDPQAKTVERRDGNSRAPMVLPVGVATDGEDRLFVSDATLHSIFCFSPTGQVISYFGSASLGRPGGIAIDSARNRLYVADAKENRIAVFDTNTFKFVAYYGDSKRPGGSSAKGFFAAPTNVALDRKGNLYVADTWNNRIEILDPAGKFIRVFGAQGDRPGEFIRPKGIAVDSEGHVYVADAEFNNFQILDPNGTPLLAVGSLGTEPGQFALVAGLHIDSKDRIYTTEMFKGRIQVFQYLSQTASVAEKEVHPAGSK